ncbi:GAF and ANTAR domain-containing protein [Actinomycetospora lemnae]|uniref:GAF and ANTAR domain-containing protein n=1 Tax=Actinomycetospora lemnae TaxID=3019891 RepID=A0ABT5STU3_9PSEU|nr:GAF and ANTAR domain-containing protein [Actinomycetospora sp. DW7H6]MDD7965900.1 GAF and ANTAR domain-containing protein [Actinomycetospora sp. DW7H6]
MNSYEHELVVSLRRAAEQLESTHTLRDVDQTLGEIVRAAVETMRCVDAGGITITEDRNVTSRGPSSEAVTKLDQLQTELAEGPCVDVITELPDDGVIVAQDLDGADAQRWPRFAPQAVEAGYRAILSTRLSTQEGIQAALNLYAAKPHAFDLDARLTAGLFGVQAAVLLYGSEQAAHLQRALDSRDVIGQAKGILMERFAVDDAQAFQMLVRSSQDTNIKLVDVARFLQEEAARRSQAPADPPTEA